MPSRFAAFPDAHLDSLDNPAYADAFTTAEGRVNFLPSINGSINAREELRDRFDLRSPRPVDYSLVPAGTIFFPVKRFRAVVGGSFGYVRNGLQSLAVNDNFSLNSPPFPTGATGFRTETGATSGNLLSGSLVVARRFGSRDRTSVEFNVERLFSRGDLNRTVTESAAGAGSFTEQIASHSAVNRTRLTFGVKHDFGAARFGAFYRFGASSGTDAVRLRFAGGIAQPLDFVRNKDKSSEFGFRLRGAFSRRLFYGAEGSLLLSDTRARLRSARVGKFDRKRARQSRHARFRLRLCSSPAHDFQLRHHGRFNQFKTAADVRLDRKFTGNRTPTRPLFVLPRRRSSGRLEKSFRQRVGFVADSIAHDRHIGFR